MKPAGECCEALENKGDSHAAELRCTWRCTETGGRIDELARAVALVASLPLSDADRAAVVNRLVAGRPSS